MTARTYDYRLSTGKVSLGIGGTVERPGSPEPQRAGVPRIARILDDHVRSGHDETPAAILADLANGSAVRFNEHIEPLMVHLDGGRVEMGTLETEATHFCGETPRHTVELSPYAITAVTITNEIYGLFDERRRNVRGEDQSMPVVGVSWIEAMLFAVWIGCSLPTEAEWEFACGAGSCAEWCCVDESDLDRYAWYSESSEGVIHEVGTLEPNAFGLFDFHGNVWEWCADTYGAGFYSSSPRSNPINLGYATDASVPLKVCRGGSMHALAEMCRTRYRQYEPADFWASDLGFRLVRRTQPPGEEGDAE